MDRSAAAMDRSSAAAPSSAAAGPPNPRRVAPRVLHCLSMPPGVALGDVVYIGGIHGGVPPPLLGRALPKYASPFCNPNVAPAVARARYAALLARCPGLARAARRDLAGKHLVCWCAPRPCHGDVLLAAAAPRRAGPA